MVDMDETKALLVKYGFIKSSAKDNYKKSNKGTYEGKNGQINPSHANVEIAEVSTITWNENPYQETGYPDSARKYRIVMESSKTSIEEPYFWVLEHTRQDHAYTYVDKITDIFSASEQSAFWGAAQSRIGIQQDRVSQYLKGISEMIKQLFQLVRELRILDEKLEPRKSWGKIPAADIALKGEYTDLVENKGGQIQPGSVYHLAQTVGYASLPDLFFNTHIYKMEDVDKKIDDLKFNPNVKSVLKRKMYAFINWKTKTDAELKSRRTFTLKYLRQHWNTIKMYMNWVKPYLRNIARMQMNPSKMESPDIVSAFETSVIEIEILAYRASRTSKHPCILHSFQLRTRPEMSFQQDQYAHKGPIHVGRLELTMRAYAWSKEEIENYKKMKREEDMMLLGMVDDSVKAAMEALGEELEKYLWEAGEKEFEDKKKLQDAEAKKKADADLAQSYNMLEPFMAIFKGFGEIFSSINPIPPIKKKEKGTSDGKAEAKAASDSLYQIYKNFKKSHQMLSW